MQPTHATFYNGYIAGTSVTGTYQDLLALSDDADVIIVMNGCNAPLFLSLPNRGSTTNVYIPALASFALDGRTNANRIAKGTIQIKHAGSAPTSGDLSVLVVS